MINLKREAQFNKIIATIKSIYEDKYKIKFPIVLDTHPTNLENLGYLDTKTGELHINFRAFDKFPSTNIGDNQAITMLFYAVCHEFQHFVQDYNPNILTGLSQTEKIMIELERKLLLANVKLGEDFYKNNHDYYLIENNADYIGVRNARTIAKSMPEFATAIDNNYYQYIENYSDYRRLVYDLPAMIERFNSFIKYNKKITQRKNNFFNNPIIYEFFDKEGNYKTVREIMNNPKLNNAEIREFTAAILSSDYFLNRLDYLQPDELTFVLECIKYTDGNFRRRHQQQSKVMTKIKATFDYIQDYSKSKKRKRIDSQANGNYYVKLQSILKKYGLLDSHTKNY